MAAPKPSKAEKADRALDKKLGIKQGSPKDQKIDKAVGVYDEEYGKKEGYGSKTSKKK